MDPGANAQTEKDAEGECQLSSEPAELRWPRDHWARSLSEFLGGLTGKVFLGIYVENPFAEVDPMMCVPISLQLIAGSDSCSVSLEIGNLLIWHLITVERS